jgi:hypothetical protein
MGLFGPSKLDKQISNSMSGIQGMQLAPEMRAAYNQSQMLSNQGMDAASKQLAIQQQSRNMNALTSQAKSKRSFLAAAPGLYQSSGDFALRLAADDAMMRRENQMAGIQMGMQFGQAQNELQRYQAEAQYNELAAKKARRAQTLNSAFSLVGAIGGAALGNPSGLAGVFGKGAGKIAKVAQTVGG